MFVTVLYLLVVLVHVFNYKPYLDLTVPCLSQRNFLIFITMSDLNLRFFCIQDVRKSKYLCSNLSDSLT